MGIEDSIPLPIVPTAPDGLPLNPSVTIQLWSCMDPECPFKMEDGGSPFGLVHIEILAMTPTGFQSAPIGVNGIHTVRTFKDAYDWLDTHFMLVRKQALEELNDPTDVTAKVIKSSNN